MAISAACWAAAVKKKIAQVAFGIMIQKRGDVVAAVVAVVGRAKNSSSSLAIDESFEYYLYWTIPHCCFCPTASVVEEATVG